MQSSVFTPPVYAAMQFQVHVTGATVSPVLNINDQTRIGSAAGLVCAARIPERRFKNAIPVKGRPCGLLELFTGKLNKFVQMLSASRFALEKCFVNQNINVLSEPC